ncbi:hypothetical protein SLS62_005105 [Diatrype stigma]|uniref:Large ribosomal subunit protein bL28m n=1 Tax=Diatrype stigma TaxID=117547 RepID=A0AAN9YPZ2_9PEZI
MPITTTTTSTTTSSTAPSSSRQTRPPNAPTRTQTRTLSTTAHPQRQKPSHLTVPKEDVPAYPYGPFLTYKQRNEGLFGRSKIRFGNTVSEKYDRKSRTTWLPNRHTKRLWSPALQHFIRTRLTASVLRTIDRLGGIDEYLLGSKQKRVRELGPAGWALRWKIIQTPAIQARFAREREALGLPPKTAETVSAEAEAGVADLVLEGGEGEGGGQNKKASAQALHDVVDGMLARDEEFVLGNEEDVSTEPEASSEAEVEVKAEAIKEAAAADAAADAGAGAKAESRI